MYNPDFWEVPLDPVDLARIPQEAGLWYESPDDRASRYAVEDRNQGLAAELQREVLGALTHKQREAVVLYFQHGKTQLEIAEILGVSRRVVSQHLFGITRNGRTVGGAVNRIRKLCTRSGIALSSPGPDRSHRPGPGIVFGPGASAAG